MENITTKESITFEQTLNYEELLLELKGYTEILFALQCSIFENELLNYEIGSSVILKRIEIICDCLQKYA